MRAGRWMRRHRTWLIAASAAALMTLVGLGAVATVQVQANRDLTRHNADLLVANRAKTRPALRPRPVSHWPATPSRATTRGQ